MKIFISWSGKASLVMATALKEILPSIIQALDPFLSSHDIESGTRWFSEIGARLEEGHYGILCLTPSNLNAPWILFEAGALSKALDRARVVPLLIKVAASDLTPPLSQFNAVKAAKEDMHKLLNDINKLCDKSLEEKRLNDTFDKFWPDLERAINSTIEELGKGEERSTPKRDDRQLLEEVLDLSRSISLSLEKSQLENELDRKIRGRRAAAAIPDDGWAKPYGAYGSPPTSGGLMSSPGAYALPSPFADKEDKSGGPMTALSEEWRTPPTSSGVMPRALSHPGAYAYPDKEDKKD